MAILSISVNNQQYDGGLWLNMSRADHMPTLLSGFVYAVPINEAALVFEDQRRQLK